MLKIIILIWGFPAWAGRVFRATSVALPPAKPVLIVVNCAFCDGENQSL